MKCTFLIAALLLSIGSGTAFAAGPEDVVEKLAATIASKDGQGFMECVNLDAMLDAEPAAYNVDAVYNGSSASGRYPLEDQIASGVLALRCKEARRPGCAWTVDGLKKPLIKTTGPKSAVVAVDNPEDIRTWIALYKHTDGWKVVGVAVTERDAVKFASEDFQKQREEYRRNRTAAEKAVEQKAADNRLAMERQREADKAKLREQMARGNVILDAVTLSDVVVTRRTNVGHDGKQKDLLILGTVVNRNPQTVAKVYWRLEFVDDAGTVLAYTNIKDTDIGDNTLRPNVVYKRKWNPDLRYAPLIKGADLYAKGKCKVVLRSNSLRMDDASVVRADGREIR